jgi:hypothetical protein
MKKKMPAKKLQLSRETLQNLHEVVGGAIGGKTTTCTSKVNTYCIASCGCATDPC